MPSPLVGAWEVVGGPLKGLIVFSGDHYSKSRIDRGRKGFGKFDDPTEAEAAEAYFSFHGWGGGYEISGSTLTLHREYVKNPDNTHRDRIFTFTIDGDKMTWVGIDQPAQLTWHKLS